MGDLKHKHLIVAKGLLFVLLGLLASVLLLWRVPDMTAALLHVVAIWAFCRSYYFAFYVIEHYVDSNYRFSGLGSFLGYMVRINRKSVVRDTSV